MSKVREQLLKKNGIATLMMAKQFLTYSVGDRVPTVTEFSEDLKISRGTVQNSLKLLTDNKAIKCESKGHLGTYLLSKNLKILLEFANITSITGAMPLPYSKKYEGLATGLVTALENQYGIPASMAYMRGSRNRIAMLLSNRCDFAIISKFAMDDYLKTRKDIVLVKDFGLNSYLSEHVIIFHDNSKTAITNGMKVAIDPESIDQLKLTEIVCKGKKVDYVRVDYSKVLERIQDGDVDAAVWNKDGIVNKTKHFNYKSIDSCKSDTEAVMVASTGRVDMIELLTELVDTDTVLNIQKLVEDGKITPSY